MAKKRKIETPDPQLDGGPDLDTTNYDKPSGLERPDRDLIGDDLGEHGPLTVVPAEDGIPGPMDPTADDPFVAGTGEAPKDFDPDSLLSDREAHEQTTARRKMGPTYEENQGNIKENHGGSVDPNDDLTEDSSGLRKSRESS